VGQTGAKPKPKPVSAGVLLELIPLNSRSCKTLLDTCVGSGRFVFARQHAAQSPTRRQTPLLCDILLLASWCLVPSSARSERSSALVAATAMTSESVVGLLHLAGASTSSTGRHRKFACQAYRVSSHPSPSPEGCPAPPLPHSSQSFTLLARVGHHLMLLLPATSTGIIHSFIHTFIHSYSSQTGSAAATP